MRERESERGGGAMMEGKAEHEMKIQTKEGR